jgi:hypothetical protein
MKVQTKAGDRITWDHRPPYGRWDGAASGLVIEIRGEAYRGDQEIIVMPDDGYYGYGIKNLTASILPERDNYRVISVTAATEETVMQAAQKLAQYKAQMREIGKQLGHREAA